MPKSENEEERGYWHLVEPIADAVSIYDGPRVFLEQFAAVRPEQGILLAAHWCWVEVCNGGFKQFFFNSTGVLAPEAAVAFETLGLTECAGVIREAMMFFGSKYPRDREKRIKKLGSQDWEYPAGPSPFNDHDDRFYGLINSENGGFETAAARFAAKFP